MLWAITPAQIAFRQPSMLRRLTYELEVTPILNVFTKDYLLAELWRRRNSYRNGSFSTVPGEGLSLPGLFCAWVGIASGWARY